MVELLYQEDSYLKKFEATVTRIDGEWVFLDRTAFCPRAGGLDGDTGSLNGLSVEEVRILEGDVGHKVPGHSFQPGEKVVGEINWERRYRMMRLHTAEHILSAILYEKTGALVTGGHITPEKAYLDFNLERLEKSLIEEAIEKANEIVRKDLEVKIYWLPREEALKIPGIIKLAGRRPPNIPVWRIVEIPGVDKQADGGPHVKRTGEIGKIVFLKAENKGKGRKRIYITVEP